MEKSYDLDPKLKRSADKPQALGSEDGDINLEVYDSSG